MSAGRAPESSRARAFAVLALVAAAYGLVRLAWLDADPTRFLLGEFITDEGWYSLNARNHALFGRWVMDEHNVALVLCPLHTLALRASYALFGVSLWSTRLVGAAASALTVLLVGIRLRRRAGTALLASALVATQPILLSLSRVAYCESLQALFITGTWFFASDEERRRRSWVLAGVCAGLAFCTKANGAWVPVLALVSPLVRGPSPARRRGAEVAHVALGGGVVALALLPLLLPHLDLLVTETTREGSVLWLGRGKPVGLTWAAFVGLTLPRGDGHPAFWLGLWPLVLLAGVSAARIVSRGAGPPDAPALRVAVAWIATAIAYHGLHREDLLNERYWSNLLVALAIVSAAGCAAAAEARAPSRPGRAVVAALLLAIGPALAARQLLVPLVVGQLSPSHIHVKVLAPTLVSLAVGALVLRRAAVAERITSRAVSAVAAAVIASGAIAVASALSNPTYTIRDAGRALRDGGGAKVLTGDVANTLSIETPFRAFVCRDLARMGLGVGWVNGDWRGLGATHWVAATAPRVSWRTQCPSGSELVTSRDLWPDPAGRPRMTLHVCDLAHARASARSL